MKRAVQIQYFWAMDSTAIAAISKAFLIWKKQVVSFKNIKNILISRAS